MRNVTSSDRLGKRFSRPLIAVPMISFVFILAATCGGEALDPRAAIDLQITKAVSNPTTLEGASVTFVVTVRNNGPSAATGVVAGDTLPTGLSYQSHTASAGSYSPSGLWTIDILSVNQEVTLTLVARTAAGTNGSTLVNTAGVLSTDFAESAPSNNIASASVSVGPPAPPVQFSSDWSTATGNSDAALTDGGKWNRMIGCGGGIYNIMSVVPGNTVGWTRTANVMRFQQRGGTVCGNIERVPTVPASTTNWGRFYFRDNETATGHSHPVTYNCCGAIQAVVWSRVGRPNGVRLQWGVGGSYPLTWWTAGAVGTGGGYRELGPGTWYRYEWMMEYVTPTSFRVWPRIYDMAGNLLYDASTYVQQDYPGAGTLTLAQHYANGFAAAITDTELARNFGVGNEGPTGSTATLGYWYIADVVISTAGWIGQ